MNKPYVFIILLSLMTSFREPPKNSIALVQFMVSKSYLSQAEALNVSYDSLFTSLYNIHRERYGIKRGQMRMGYYSDSELAVQTNALIQQIYSLKLISHHTYKDIQLKFENRNKETVLAAELISDEFALFEYLSEMEQATGNKRQVNTYLQQLKRVKLISPDLELPEQLSTKGEILNLIDHKLILDIETFPDSISECYRLTYQLMEQLDPDLKISNYSFAIENVQHGQLEYQSAVVRFTNSGNNYVAKNSYSAAQSHGKLDLRFYRVFNKILSDHNSKFRILNIGRTNDHSFCLLLLTEEQFNFLQAKEMLEFRYFDPNWYKIQVSEYWNPFDILGKDETEKYFETYDSLGLLNHLTETNKARELERIVQTFIYSPESILWEIEGICLGFDWEMFGYEQPYKKAILDFASITRGEFQPERITDDFSFSNARATFSFDFNGKTYEETVDVNGDWYEPEFIELINAAHEENHLSGRYYDLPGGGQTSEHIYLTETQYEFLSQNELLKFNSKED